MKLESLGVLLIKQEQIAASKFIAGGNQAVTGAGQTLGAQTTGIKEWNDLSPRDVAKKEFKAATKKDEENKAKGLDSDLAGAVRRKWIERNTPGAKPAPAPAPKGAAPGARLNALPPGAVYAGTSGGKKVYKTPDGKQYIQD